MKKFLGFFLSFFVLLSSVIAIAGGGELAYLKVQELNTISPSTIDPTADFIPVYDASAGKVYKALGSSIIEPEAKFSTNTTTTTFAAGQLTGANYVVYTNTQGTPGSIATRTATQMFGDDSQARVNRSYVLRIINGQGTGVLTVTAGSGVTLTGTATIATNSYRDFIVTYTSATALTMQNIGGGTL